MTPSGTLVGNIKVLRFGSLFPGVDSYSSGFSDLSLVTVSPLMVWVSSQHVYAYFGAGCWIRCIVAVPNLLID